MIRSKRKTVAIHIYNGAIEVRAPLKMPESGIEQFIKSKEKWIADRLALSRQNKKKREDFRLDYGDTVKCFGDLYIIAGKEHIHFEIENEYFYIPPGLTPEQIKQACIRIYRKFAKTCLLTKTIDFAKLMSVTPVDVKITGAKSRWGSCSKKGINFAWRLMMADEGVIDYVVVHELAHIIEMNHSKRFWAIVESILPDYKERKRRLKGLQNQLEKEDWD